MQTVREACTVLTFPFAKMNLWWQGWCCLGNPPYASSLGCSINAQVTSWESGTINVSRLATDQPYSETISQKCSPMAWQICTVTRLRLNENCVLCNEEVLYTVSDQSINKHCKASCLLKVDLFWATKMHLAGFQGLPTHIPERKGELQLRFSVNFTAEAFSHFEGLKKSLFFFLRVRRTIKNHPLVTFISFIQCNLWNKMKHLVLSLLLWAFLCDTFPLVHILSSW